MQVKSDSVNSLLEFIHASPTPYHAVENMSLRLEAAGFSELKLADKWQLELQHGYYVRENGSICAFYYTGKTAAETGYKMLGSHTDSPCLMLKPSPTFNAKGYAQFSVEIYGGVLLNTWFDRDLGLAGLVHFIDESGQKQHVLINSEMSIAVVPSLAIHLNRNVHTSKSVNPQIEMNPIFALENSDESAFDTWLKSQVEVASGCKKVQSILHFELCFYDTQKPAIVGLNNEFISGARLDNLLSAYVSLEALLNTSKSKSALIVSHHHEEVGSNSQAGARGQLLISVLKRCYPEEETYRRLISQSLFASVDNSHAVHPNYAEKHDHHHAPTINAGPALKINLNQSYTTTSETGAYFKYICEQNNVPCQTFSTRNDMGCGSTIGPSISANLGVKAFDVGVPTFGMHSIREMGGVKDVNYLLSALTALLSD